MICLLDLSADFWRNFHASKGSSVETYQRTLEGVQYWTDRCERTIVLCDGPRLKRVEWYADYKGNRPPKPQEAVDSLCAIKEQIQSWGTPLVECEGYEADDLMATVVRQAWPEDVQIVTRDKDIYQLIDETCWLMAGGKIVREQECIAKFGVRPNQIRDFLSLTGDESDNIPGCPHTGPGRARDLLQRFGTITKIQAASDEEILAVRGIGQKTLMSLRVWDPTLAIKLVSLLDDAPVELEKLWPSAA